MIRLIALLALLALLLNGCATQLPAPSPPPASIPWEQRQRALSMLDSWMLQGKIAIRVDQQNHAANLSWTQQGDHYRIFMAGPFGRGAVDIEGDEHHLRLLLAGEDPLETDAPQALLEQRLGWSFPLQQLAWWVRGLPAPDSAHRLTLDSQHRLQQLQQSGWQINYPRYALFATTELPAKLVLTRGDQLKLTLILKTWQLGSDASPAQLVKE